MIILGANGSGKTYTVSKFGKPYGKKVPPDFYEKEVFIGNKYVHLMIKDPLTSINGLIETNSVFKNLAAAFFVFNPYADPDQSQLAEMKSLLS